MWSGRERVLQAASSGTGRGVSAEEKGGGQLLRQVKRGEVVECLFVGDWRGTARESSLSPGRALTNWLYTSAGTMPNCGGRGGGKAGSGRQDDTAGSAPVEPAISPPSVELTHCRNQRNARLHAEAEEEAAEAEAEAGLQHGSEAKAAGEREADLRVGYKLTTPGRGHSQLTHSWPAASLPSRLRAADPRPARCAAAHLLEGEVVVDRDEVEQGRQAARQGRRSEGRCDTVSECL